MTDAPTNPTTADLATARGALPLRRLHLIGVAGPPEDRRALLRSAGGAIQTVRVGDKVRRAKVVAIDADAVILSGPGGAEVLRLPDITGVRSAA